MHSRYLCDHVCDRLSALQLQRFLVFLSIQALLLPWIGVAQRPDDVVTDVGTKSTVELLSYNGLDLVRAIADARVTTAVLMSDVTLQEGDWAGIATPVLIKRNFTVQGDPGIAPDLRILNMNWIAKKVSYPGATYIKNSDACLACQSVQPRSTTRHMYLVSHFSLPMDRYLFTVRLRAYQHTYKCMSYVHAVHMCRTHMLLRNAIAFNSGLTLHIHPQMQMRILWWRDPLKTAGACAATRSHWRLCLRIPLSSVPTIGAEC